MESRLVKKQTKLPTLCHFCSDQIPPDETYYLEEGISDHIHSLIARKYCAQCYTKYGEQKLLKGKK